MVRAKWGGFALAIFTAVVWGSTFVATKSLLVSFSPFEILFIRYALGYACLWALYPRALKLRHKSHEWLFVVTGLTGITLYQFMENTSLVYTQASNASIIVSSAPLWTAVFVWLFPEKHSPRAKIGLWFMLGFIAAMSGIALIAYNGAVVLRLNPRGDILALAAGILWGVYSLFMGKINALGYPTLAATRRMFFYALICMIPLGFFAVPSFDAAFNATRFLRPLNALNLLFLGVAASALCFASWNKASKILGVVRASAFIYAIPAVTVCAAALFIHERITAFSIAGMALTTAGLVITERAQ
jgi:drug/metabolite transporter (DMT)-like permease